MDYRTKNPTSKNPTSKNAISQKEFATLQKKAEEKREQEKLESDRQEKARLEQEIFQQAKLEQAKLEQARLEQARLERAQLEQAQLERERLERAQFKQDLIEHNKRMLEQLEKQKIQKQMMIERGNAYLKSLVGSDHIFIYSYPFEYSYGDHDWEVLGNNRWIRTIKVEIDSIDMAEHQVYGWNILRTVAKYSGKQNVTYGDTSYRQKYYLSFQNQPPIGFDNLPLDITRIIISFLDEKSICSLMLSAKSLIRLNFVVFKKQLCYLCGIRNSFPCPFKFDDGTIICNKCYCWSDISIRIESDIELYYDDKDWTQYLIPAHFTSHLKSTKQTFDLGRQCLHQAMNTNLVQKKLCQDGNKCTNLNTHHLCTFRHS